jgi:hypothetical protein
VGDPVDIADLARKLVTTFHLNVEERAAFAGKPVPGSLIRSAIFSILKERGSFPPGWPPCDPYDGGLIEAKADGTCSITWKAEVSIARYEVMEVQEHLSASAAVAAYAERFFGSAIDGILVDWSA